MEENNKSKLSIVIIVLAILISLFCLYLLNDKYGWIDINKDDTNTEEKEDKKDTEEEKLTNLFYYQRAFLEEIAESSNIDVTKTLSSSEKEIRQNFLNIIIPINKDLETNIKAKTDALLTKNSISTDDISELRREMIVEAEGYNIALGNLLGDAENNELYTIITYQAPLNSYYYFDGIEETYLIEVNYAYLYNIMKEKLTPAARAYAILKNEVFKYNNSNYFYKDGGLSVTWNEFKEIILIYDTFVKAYPNETKVNDEYKILFDIYVGTTILPNSPISEDVGVAVKAEVLNTYKDIVDNHKDFTKYNEVKTIYDANK